MNIGTQSYYVLSGAGIYEDGDSIQRTFYPASNTTLTTNPDWRAAFSYSTPCPSSPGSNYNFEFQIGNNTSSAGGYLYACTIAVSGPMGTSPLAKEMGNVGGSMCGCTGSDPALQETGMAQVAEPIEVGTGNLFYSVTDYKTVGQNPLEFTRYYNSTGGISSFASSLGTNWRSNYDRYLQLGNSTVTAERPDGQQVTFTLLNGVWQSDSDVDVSLVNSGSTWTLTDHDDTVETYTTATGLLGTLEVSCGQLQSIKRRNGYTQTLNRSTANQLKITDSYSRVLTLSYAGGLLQTVTTPDTLVLTYGITNTAGGNQLTSVSYNTSPVTDQTYLYGDTSFPFALTGITDENGIRYATWTYDSTGRALSSHLGTGANATTLTYNSDGTTTVENAHAVKDTYTFSILQGVSKVTSIARASTPTTQAANRTFGYDGNGYLNSATDWDGNQVTYSRDAHGQPTTITAAAASAVQRTTTIAYDATWVHLPSQITTTGLTTTFKYDGSGNPLTRTDLDTTTNSVPYSTGGQSRVTSWTWTGSGRVTSMTLPRTDVSAKTTFGYSGPALTQIQDALGHTTKVTAYTGSGLPITGQRLEKTLAGEHPILYQYGITDGALLSENDLNKGQTADYIYLNGRPIAEINPTTGALYFTHTDRLGTPQKLTGST